MNGNDPNVGRLLCAVGQARRRAPGIPLDPARVAMRVGGETVLEGGAMRLDPAKEQRLVAAPEGGGALRQRRRPPDGLTFRPPVDYPPHERRVEIEIDLGLGARVVRGPRRRPHATST